MTNNPERIRKLLEPFGYVATLAPPTTCTDANTGERRYFYKTKDGRPPFPHGVWYPDGESITGYSSENGQQWHAALVHFLNDNNQTGARIANLGAHGYGVFVHKQPVADGLRWFAMCRLDHKILGKIASDPDEAIATLWLKAHGLKDPRGAA